MHNFFIIAGPPSDPAGVGTSETAVQALRAIARGNAAYLSRGDDSGTHKKERELFALAGVQARGWAAYREAGQGMAATLRMADQLEAYVLCDIGTYLALSKTIELEALYERDEALLNPYSVIEVAPRAGIPINSAGARAFATFLALPSTQAFIAKFGVERFGRPLFVPDRLGPR